ncbi:MAG: aspartate dehydrogenase domain-containing protein [Myxococcota bacterium]|nr:aspartate dehydrogenase domain-containing protein [Myxococcota bacterium]
MSRRIGIVGYGKLGQHLIRTLNESEGVELAFVWNQEPPGVGPEIPQEKTLKRLEDFARFEPDLVVEVAHPVITWEHGPRFLSHCNYLAGSPTAFARDGVEAEMRRLADNDQGRGLYIPRGALPGLNEVLRMVDKGKLGAAEICMQKHPSSLKYGRELNPPLSETTEERTVYDGPLRELCSLAPNNVNTMAVLALASQLGFDAVRARLVADPSLQHHITSVRLLGHDNGGPRYSLDLIRKAPAGAGAVTSTATLTTFATSMLEAHGQGSGVHFC